MALEKHKKYKDKYGSNEIFWGLGIEEETYLQYEKPVWVATPILRTCHKAERYSVDYYKSYQPQLYTALEKQFPDASGFVALPFFLNGHGFLKMDVKGQHTTLYRKVPPPNPAFKGKTLFQELQEFAPATFKEPYEKTFTFDGDTIEFMTQDFYKANAKTVIQELVENKEKFLKEINRFLVEKGVWKERGLLRYPPQNPGFAVYSTNPSNIAMFNNGTYHINITLPCLLGVKDEDGIAPLVYPEKFREDHRAAIRMFQWVEPFLIAAYGTPDPLTGYSKASQRCAISRYIGIGTYNTDIMPEGKLLTFPRNEVRGSSTDFWWYTRYHKKSGYSVLEKIGMDINYRKHYNHGIELRLFDWFPEDKLYEVIEFLVHVCELAADLPLAPEAVLSETWNDFVVGVLRKGCGFQLTDPISAMYERITGIEYIGKNLTAESAFLLLRKSIRIRYKGGALRKVFL